jgi:HD-GYP domain-containing protein (c-di-GMP phosphodiesterase class II)
LLHDLGKLRVPDEILDKPGSLTPNERLVIQTHSFETWQILRHIRGFEDIARWAACHHEEPDGTGYPFHLKASEIPLEARILRVADIMEAMAQDRPYRAGLKADEVARFLIQLSQEGRVDKDVAHAALGIMDEAMSAVRS